MDNSEKLAVEGGEALRQLPLSPWPIFARDEIDAVTAVLASGKVNYWTGEQGRLFEQEFASFSGCRHAIVLANGTLALELALHALGVGPGDEVIVTSRTFIASASCVVMRGATPVVVDVDPVAQNITADSIRPAITARTKAVIAVHLAGWPCDMESIMALACEHGLWVIEDCAQAHGATYKGAPVGSLGDVAAFSFCQDKIMSTGGEGGMLTTNDERLWERAWAFKDHGKSYDAIYRRQHPPGFRWVHESFGTNWRMTEMQSAIGRLQLGKLSSWVATRRTHAARLTDAFQRIAAFRTTTPPAEVGHAYYKYYAFVRPELLRSGWNRNRVVEAIAAEGIPCFNGGCSEIYLEKAFTAHGLLPARRLPTARELGASSMMFQVHPTLSEAEMADTCRAVAKVMKHASR